MIAGPVVTRFAPSPTGRLHVGNIRTALLCWLAARQGGGRFLLRLDDTDAARSTETFAQAIRADLTWLGLIPDGEVRQSERGALYDAALGRLAAAGRAYPAYETPDDLALKRRLQRAAGRPPVYDRAALALTDADRARLEGEGRRPHWRFRLETDALSGWNDLVRGPTALDCASLSDPIVRRADGGWLYMLPSVVDDIEMGVTHIVRGEDHVPNSAIQLQMFAALGAPAPAMAHAALLTSAAGELSKRLGSEGVDAIAAAGIEPVALLAYLGRLGTSDPVEPMIDLAPLLASFDFAKLGRATARYDPAEVAALNEKIVHRLPFAAVAGRLPIAIGAAEWAALQGNLATVAAAGEWADVFAGDLTPAPDPALPREAAALLPAALWDGETWGAWTRALRDATGLKGKMLFQPLRRALTGRDHGPEMAALLPLIGRARALARLEAAVA